MGVGLILSPLYYIVGTTLASGAPFDPSLFFHVAPKLQVLCVLLGPFVGALVLTVRPVGWYAILLFSLFSLGLDIQLLLTRRMIPGTVWLAAVASLFGAVYFVRREIASPYFNPRLRWWDNARTRQSLKVDVTGRETFESSTHDLSPTGVFLASDRSFVIGETLELTLHLPSGPRTVSGQVVWLSDGTRPHHPKGVGIRFR